MDILIINDPDFEKTVLETTLKEFGFHSKSGDEYSAVEMIKDEKAEIIFSNLHMKEQTVIT